MSAKYTLTLAAGIVVVVGVVIATQWEGHERAAVAEAPPPSSPGAASKAATSPPPRNIVPRSSTIANGAAATKPAPGFTSSHEAQFKEATDYLAFARDMLPKARAGDPDAQFHLYSTLQYCRTGYRAFFDRGQKRRSLDEALRQAANGPRSDMQEIPKIHARCHKLMESDIDELGEPQQWLQNAAVAKHPRAQVELAANFVIRASLAPPDQAARSLSEGRRLAREALASRDPAVIWKMGSLTLLRTDPASGDDLDVMAYAWAACDRGLDCSAGSEPVSEFCRVVPDCQPFESVQDLLLRTSRSPAAVEDRAKWINQLIDAGDWQALGFADPPSGP